MDTSPVGNYPTGASPYGALDMAGNVWEWVNDWYGYDYYHVSPSSNPPGPSSGRSKVMRGGSWRTYGGYDLRVVFRDRNDSFDPGRRENNVSFRCAVSP
ncbi:MAG: formylglycine-generating enzyme family protein [Chloroflexi bacterium]|nr:formylglycine-generating enzyme family protein [Chloroflexota bacterium]